MHRNGLWIEAREQGLKQLQADRIVINNDDIAA